MVFSVKESKMDDKKNYVFWKRYKILFKIICYKEIFIKKRIKVEDDLSVEWKIIIKIFDFFDDILGFYNRGVDMDGMDIKEVSMIDNNILLDYFYVLNGNVSEGNNNNNFYNNMLEYVLMFILVLIWDEGFFLNIEENSGSDDFYDVIDCGDKFFLLKMKKVCFIKFNFDMLMYKLSKYVGFLLINLGIGFLLKFCLFF